MRPLDNPDKVFYSVRKKLTYTVCYQTKFQEVQTGINPGEIETPLLAYFEETTAQDATDSIPAGFVTEKFVEGNLLPKMCPNGKVYIVKIIRRANNNTKYFTPDEEDPEKYKPELPVDQAHLAWLQIISKGYTGTVRFKLVAQYWPGETFINNVLFDGKKFTKEGKGMLEMPTDSFSNDRVTTQVPVDVHSMALDRLSKQMRVKFPHGHFYASHIPIYVVHELHNPMTTADR